MASPQNSLTIVNSIVDKIEMPLSAENISSIALNILALLINMDSVAKTDYAKLITDALDALIKKQSLSDEDKLNLSTLVAITVPQAVKTIDNVVEEIESGSCCCFGKKKKTKKTKTK